MGNKLKFVRQLSQTSCGAACVTMILNYYGNKIQIFEVSKHCSPSRNGTTLKELTKVCTYYGIKTKAVEMASFDRIEEIKNFFPCIAVIESHHYVVITKIKKGKIYYNDPQYGEIVSLISEFGSLFSGVLLLLEPTDKLHKSKKKVSYLSVLKLGKISISLFIGILISTIILQALSLFSPWVTQYMIDCIVSKQNYMDITSFLISSIIVVVVYGLMNYLRQFLSMIMERRYISNIKKAIVDKIFRIPLDFFDTRSSGEIATRINNIDTLKHTISQIGSSMTVDLLSIIIFGIVMLINSFFLSLIVFVFAAFLCVILIISLKAIKRRNLDVLLSQEVTQSYLVEALSNMVIVKSSSFGSSIADKWNELHNNQLEKSIDREKILNIYRSFLLSFRMLPPLIILVVGSTLIGKDGFTLGTLMSFVTISSLFLSPISIFVQNFFELQYAASILDRIMEIMYTDDEVETGSKIAYSIDRIEFCNVSFSYSTEDGILVLSGVDFEIEKGDKIAFIGKTGCGKTTLIKLMLGLYHPISGLIRINGHPLNEYNLDSYRKKFGVVLQDAMFFNDTIKNNIDLTKSHSIEQIRKAARLACLSDEIEKMPLGYDTFIGDNGRNISGGQRQRLAIARAFIENPAIVLFDEGTNQLDAITEKMIYENLKSNHITQIVITHRLPTVQDADNIFLIENGRIVDSGTHEQLVKASEYYNALFENQ